MRRFGIALLLACTMLGIASTAAAAKDSNTTAGAEAATRRFFEFINNRQWGPYYGYLHPAQRALITKDDFTSCIDEAVPEGFSVEDIEFTDHYKESATIPGTGVKAKTTALTYKHTLQQGSRQQSATDTTHVIWAKSKWTWAMGEKQFASCTETET
jgi:hypothetical protein